MAATATCACGDGSGWIVWRPRRLNGRGRDFVWAACADCNDDGLKPKPPLEICEGCGETALFCGCR
jgi:hypothetical protein